MALPLPWILHIANGENDILCFIFSNVTLNFFPLPSTFVVVFPPFCSWLFVLNKVPPSYYEQSAYHINPISGSRVQLPTISSSVGYPCVGVLSSSPADPDCMSLIIDLYDESIWVCQVHGQGKWIKLPPCPVILVLDGSFYGDSLTAIFCWGKFYCFSSRLFRVVDPLFPSPSIKTLDMNCPAGHLREAQSHYLVSSNGEVLIVAVDGTGLSYDRIQDFRVFRADFSRMTWVMVKELDDRVLFVDAYFAFSLSTAEVGCKKNLIYYTYSFEYGDSEHRPPLPAWRVFDMDARDWTDGPSLLGEAGASFSTLWFLPSLEYANPL